MKLNKIFSAFMLIAAISFAACEEQIPGGNGNGPDKPDPNNPTTTDTVAIPDMEIPAEAITVSEARNICAGLESEATTEQAYYVKGWVKKMHSGHADAVTGYGNGRFYMSENQYGDGKFDTDDFQAYQVYYLNNKKFTSADQVQVGDYVVIYGKLTNYNGTYETVGRGQAYVYATSNPREGADNPDNPDNPNNPEPPKGTPTGDGTEANPYNSVAALNLIATLENDVNSDSVYVKGVVMNVESFNSQYNNITYSIADDKESSSLLIYGGAGLNGEPFTSIDDLQVGDTVVVKGCLVDYYGNTPEMTHGNYLVSLKKGQGGSTDEPIENGIKVKAVDLGLANAEALTTITLEDGTTLSFDAGGNNNGPKYYDNGSNVRMYPKNTMTIAAAKNIASVTLKVSTASGTICNASEEVTTTTGTIAFDGNDIKVSDANATSLTLTNTNGASGAASQIRWTEITIIYAE